LPIWVDFMKQALAGRPSQAFHPPPGVMQVAVDPETGEVAHAGCPTHVTEVFIAGTEPQAFCALHSTAAAEERAITRPRPVSPRDGLFPGAERPEATSP